MEEQRRILGEFGEELSMESLSAMNLLHNNIQVRLHLRPLLQSDIRFCFCSCALLPCSGPAICTLLTHCPALLQSGAGARPQHRSETLLRHSLSLNIAVPGIVRRRRCACSRR